MMSGNPLSWPQEQCHIIDQLYPYSAVNIIGGVVTIEGIVDLPRLHAAIQSAIRQFDALRMWFVMGEESEVVSQVQPYHWRDIRHLTFSPDYDKENLRPAAIETFVDEWFRQPFTLLAHDLFEFVTFTCGEQYSGYLFKAHHGIADGWSMALLSNHVKRAYEQQDVPDDASPAYSAFLAQQQSYQASTRFAVDRGWWRDYIDEYRDCFPDSSPIVTTEGISCSTWLEPAMINRLYRLCNRYGCTLNTLFIALFALYRARVWGEEKGVIGVPLANRHTREARRCFGMFTNQLPLAYRLVRTERFCERVAFFQANNQLIEAQRIKQRTMYDVEMMQELGYCSGIENYSRIISERPQGSAPMTLLDFFPEDFVLFVDESHVTLPQVRAMYNGDRARKNTLVEYGFRLPCAFDNRPLKFEEFEKRVNQIVYVSATPGEYERTRSGQIVEQVIRPTGLLDPVIEVRPVEGQIDDLIGEINTRTARNERILVTTLTKRMAEDLTTYLQGAGIKVRYMHHDIDAMERMEIIRDLRLGTFHVLVGINLLREGLDLPEVSLVAILDADKEGFLRSETSLIQTIGRAARNAQGMVVMYADTITPSMRRAIDETERRRGIQDAFNQAHGIVPKTVIKSVRNLLDLDAQEDKDSAERRGEVQGLTKQQKAERIARLEKEMREAAKMLEFELAAALRDQIIELRGK